MVITSLCDNLALPGFAAEHGLSLWIDTGKERILFDFGQTDAYEANAQKLGIHLAEADFGFLSHGHYDHGGGLARFLAANSHAPVYLSPYAFEDHRNRLGNYIGLAPMESPRLLTRGCPGCHSSLWQGKFPIDTSGMTCQGQQEDFRHEQYLLLEDGGRRILFSGCSHKGIFNLVEHFRPDILVGGFHFMRWQSRQRLEDAAKRLLCYPCRYITCHCTGQEQYEIIKQYMGGRITWLRAGQSLTL